MTFADEPAMLGSQERASQVVGTPRTKSLSASGKQKEGQHVWSKNGRR